MQSGTLDGRDLLCEFLTEELPPINLEKNIGEAFALSLKNELKGFINNNPEIEFFVTPRRFACIIRQIATHEPEQRQSKRGPSVAQALKDNQPTNALLGFLKSCDLAHLHDLEQKNDGYFYAEKITPGRKLADVLPGAIQTALKKLPIAKNMRWGSNEYSFVRPVHNLVIMLDEEVICQNSNILGLMPVNYTYGHRVMSEGKITITPDTYQEQMQTVGRVQVNFAKRREYIQQELSSMALKSGLKISDMPGLLDEVTALVEYPAILQGEFDSMFLKVPQECLILTMAKNQKYFALLDNTGKLTNKFLFVANIESTNPGIIVKGNEKVLAARLNDARFFFEMDLKHKLDEFVEKSATVVYHNLLGSQLQRNSRLQLIAEQIAGLVGIDKQLAIQTAGLLKADLTTEMVGEFPELQGIMGREYARANGLSDEIANAIEKHYYPRFSGDKLPDTLLATVMALSDKLETLVGIWGIGLVPTGEKDPFALRRAALGVVRILLENNLDVKELLHIAYNTFEGLKLNPNTVDEVYDFIKQRLANYLISVDAIPPNCVQSVLAMQPLRFNHLPSLLAILQSFASQPDNQPLLQANKRIHNILEKNAISLSGKADVPKKELFSTDEEKNLYTLLINKQPQIYQAKTEHNWSCYFSLLAEFNQPIAKFFDNVIVMDKDIAIKNNRISLLQHLYGALNQACELSELA